MTSAVVVCFFMHLFLEGMGQKADQKPSFTLRQDQRFVSARAGDTMTLRCFYEGDDSAWLYWYKQSLGENLKLISTFYIFDTRITFEDEFKDSSRFTLSTENKSHHLTIRNLQTSDSAAYYCARSFSLVLTFAEGTVLTVKGSSLTVQSEIHQEIVQHGESTTLDCTVHTGSCNEEHRVYWFKNSEKSHQEMIYTYGGTRDECQGESNTCVYNLLINNLNSSHAGTYYCAVASCGHVLFGNGTMLDIKDEDSLDLVFILSGALAVTTIIVVLLALSLKKRIKSNISHRAECQAEVSARSTGDAEENLHYAALNVIRPKKSRRQKNNINNDECVYSGVKL